MSNVTTVAPDECINADTNRIDDLMTLLGSGLSAVAIVFTMILYGHYKHLHSPANTLFIFGILGVTLCAAVNYFMCIFTMSDPNEPFSRQRCNACGFMEQIHSFVEPFLSTVFWVQIYCMLHKIDFICFRGKREILATIGVAWVLGAASATAALANDWYRQDNQVWCWIANEAELMWFKLTFCWIWVGGTFASMCLALANPLFSDTLNEIQKRLLWRRAILGCVWVVVCAVDICARFLRDEQASIIQATCEPLLGLLNVLAFLYSERMITFRALGLPPGGEPTYGFTAALRYIPDKIMADEQSILISR